jgi:hypothetical protein
MSMQPKPITFSAKPDQPTDQRVADALEFIAMRLAGIEQALTVIRDDVRQMAHVRGSQLSTRG